MVDHHPRDSFPLPHGTHVVTRVDRDVSGERIAAGAVGRVVGSGQGLVDVQVLGVGVVRYAAAEVVPFRGGQIRYAVDREAAWSALRPNVVLEAIVGSHAWGLADATSDVDRRGVFVLPFPWTASLGDAPEQLVSADGSSTYWEAAKCIQQALRGDPNTLEMLFVPGVVPSDAIGEWILADRSAFASQRIHASFGQYALSQLKKLRQSLQLDQHRDLVMGWLRDDGRLSLDQTASRLADAARIVAPTQEARRLVAKEHLKQLYGSLFDQGVLHEKTFDALRAMAQARHEAASLSRRLRPKNAYNLLRLLITATRWLATGEPVFEMSGSHRSELMAIKRGEVDLPEVLARAEQLARDLDAARRQTRLPSRPDIERAQGLLLKVRTEVARRWLEGERGPFGTGAADAPLPEWNP